MQNLYDDARDYLSRHFGVDLKGTPEDAVVTAVEALYDGGWTAYRADFERFMSKARAAVASNTLTPLQRFAKMRALVGGSSQVFRLKLHEEVVSVTITEDTAEAMIRTCSVEARRSRDKITSIGLKKITYRRGDYKLPGGGTIKVWSTVPTIDTVEMPVNEDVLTWGRAWTADRLADLEWQEETCYRPGTDTFPMDGPIRKLEISHEQAFADEDFQTPTTR